MVEERRGDPYSHSNTKITPLKNVLPKIWGDRGQGNLNNLKGNILCDLMGRYGYEYEWRNTRYLVNKRALKESVVGRKTWKNILGTQWEGEGVGVEGQRRRRERGKRESSIIRAREKSSVLQKYPFRLSIISIRRGYSDFRILGLVIIFFSCLDIQAQRRSNAMILLIMDKVIRYQPVVSWCGD